MRDRHFTLLMNQLTTLIEEFIELKAMLAQSMHTSATEVYLDSHQMERLLKCSPSTLYRLRKNEMLPYIMVGGQYRYPRSYYSKENIEIIMGKPDRSLKFDD